ncbi:hypothetical protein [Streptomyces sp. NPDC006739]|uniref:hypothetical protein n=1 Tax=Streptomyces sp. NPDC006739 TaxID=3364763 RepID=UPI0036B3E3D0
MTATFEGASDGSDQFTVTIAREPIREHAAQHVPQDAETVTPAVCADCGGSRECARCEGHGHLDGERCTACDSLGICPTCRERETE